MSPLLVAQIYSIMLFILGISLLASKDNWKAAIEELINQKYGVLLFSLGVIPYMLVIVLVHSLWAWTPTVLITFAGWTGLLKHVIFLINPHFPKHIMPGILTHYGVWSKVQGLVITILGALMIYYTFIDISPLYFPNL